MHDSTRRRSVGDGNTPIKRLSDAANTAGAWWATRQGHAHSHGQQDPQSVAYSDLGPTYLNPASPSLSGETSNPPAPHLAYRDQSSQQQFTSDGTGTHQLQEQEALRKAVEASKQDDQAGLEKRRLKEQQESDELRQALAESARLARARQQTTSPQSQQEQAELSRALLESQRQALFESQARAHAAMDAAPTSTPAPAYDTSDLERSERALRTRNEKGSLWAEASRHGWLPAGAQRPGEDERELQMLELAIRLSLAEEEERSQQDEMERQEAIERADNAGHAQRPTLIGNQPSDATSALQDSFRTAQSSFSQTSSPPKPRRKPPPPPPLALDTPPISPHMESNVLFNQPPPLPPYPPTASRYNSTGSSSLPQPNRAPPSPPSSTLQPEPFQLTTSNMQAIDRSGSPYEMPYLVSSPTVSSNDRSPFGDSSSASASGSGAGTSGGGGHSLSQRSSASFVGSASASSSVHDEHQLQHQQQRRAEDHVQDVYSENGYSEGNSSGTGLGIGIRRALTIRNPDVDTNATTDSAPKMPALLPSDSSGRDTTLTEPPAPLAQEERTTMAMPPFESSMTGRSLSLVSEATEPASEVESPLSPVSPNSLRTPIANGSAGAGGVTGARTSTQLTMDAQPALQAQLSDEPEQVLAEEDEQDNGEDTTLSSHGVRFGFSSAPPSSQDAQNAEVGDDGLSGEGRLPELVELATATAAATADRTSFSIEAGSWVALLRVLMWYGDSRIVASAKDIREQPTRRCDAALSLSFKGSSARGHPSTPFVRLSATLLRPHEHSTSPAELTCTTPVSSTSTAFRSRPAPAEQTTTFQLPDHVVLPARLSSIAVSLYSLRHLAQIAQSTQPAKNAGPSYHALRRLAAEIQALSSNAAPALALGNDAAGGVKGKGKGRATAPPSSDQHEDLVGRVRERLRRMRMRSTGGGSGGSSSSFSNTVPPTSSNGHALAEGSGSGAGFDANNPSGSALNAPAGSAKLVKLPPPAKTTAVRRQERVLLGEEGRDPPPPPPPAAADAPGTSGNGDASASLGDGGRGLTTAKARSRSDEVENDMRWMPTL